VRATLTGREHSVVNALFEILTVGSVFSEKDETSTRTAEGLVAEDTLV